MRVRSTTILSVRRGDSVAIGGDGQVSFGDTVMKMGARKLRTLAGGKVITGFAGSAGDAFALLEKFEKKLEEHNHNTMRAAVEMAKLWRTDRMLRKLESMIVVVDKERSLLLSGSGDVIEPDDGVLAIGSGGQYAAAAARALLRNTEMSPEAIVKEAMNIAADICVYTNHEIRIETL